MTIPRRKTGTRAGAGLLSASLVITGAVVLGAAPAQGADDEVHTQTFLAGPQTTFTIPENATSVQLIVAGDQGGSRMFGNPALGGAGGIATVDLGAAYNGATLDLLVGPLSGTIGAAGSFVALNDEFLVIAGAGGTGGQVLSGEGTSLPGGAGGFSSTSPDGNDGTQYLGYNHSGTGATGATPGISGYSTLETGGRQNGTTATVVDGVITPGVGSTSPAGVVVGGAQGYAGGGGGRDELLGGDLIRSAGGGGSGYLAPDLELISATPNVGDGVRALGYVTIIWTTPVEDTEEPGTDDPDDTDEDAAPSRPQDGIVLPIVAG